MKKLFLFLCLVPTLALSQVSSWRTNPPSSNSSSSVGRTTSIGTSSWRNESPKDFNKPQSRNSGSHFVVNDPWMMNRWGWNRWGMWGAPMFGWEFWTPMHYWNDWGYRQPARIFVYKDGKTDTVMGKKPIYNFGIQTTTDRQIGGFFAVGRKIYFIAEFNSTYEKDNSTYFPYGRLDLVDFPLVDDIVKTRTFYGGLGKRFKRTGVHIQVGGIKEIVRFRGKDDVGYITFPKSDNLSMTIKLGVLHDFKNFTVKTDFDPVLKNATFGVGLNF